ncbi:DUF4041 domain-containing protein [Pectinatus frisingensis]|uniref:DUF4041 domain-containing protein n=1 Tax=Pectinatus frisingensis TaxID=865 RepID=UPI0018C4D48C|nr:DUF4041 domain-containing protein [Pectinatus frisingensis]
MDKISLKEKWYFNNVTISILLIICSIKPFAAILVIPLIIFKTKKLRVLAQDKLVLAQEEADKIMQTTEAKLENLNTKIKNKQDLVDNIIKSATTYAENQNIEKKKILAELESKISNKDAIIHQIIEDAEMRTKKKVEKISADISNKETYMYVLDNKIAEKKEKIIELDEEALLQDFSLYKPMYDFINSEQYKSRLDYIRQRQKDMIKQKTAADGDTNWTVNNNKIAGRKMVQDTQKLLLRAFNSECEHVTGKVKYNNFESCEKRITNAYTAISKLGQVMQINISSEYYNLKIKELHLAFEYQQMKQKEKEHQREVRARMREEARLQKEIEAERLKIEKEKIHYSNALEAAKQQYQESLDSQERNALTQKINDLENQMEEIKKNLSDIDYREANQRAGYVYVISNIGSFGNNIYKIGMTRRLDPMERIYELSDASVPFNFDVHAMIFSDDAPKLETALHNAFDNKKLNLINTRREFFNVSLDQIEHVVKENFDGTVEFKKLPDAEQYRESMKMKQVH